MRVLLLSAAVLLLVTVPTVVVVLRRNGRTGEDLLASQLRSIADPQPVQSPNRPTGTPPWREQEPSVDQRASPELPEGVDDATWRRIGELAVAGRRVQAIELLRTVAGCRLTEAKAVVDRLSRQGARSADDM